MTLSWQALFRFRRAITSVVQNVRLSPWLTREDGCVTVWLSWLRCLILGVGFRGQAIRWRQPICYIFATKAHIDNRKSSNISTFPHNMVNFGLLAAEIGPIVWGTPANFNGFRVLAALLHGNLLQQWASAKICSVEQRAPSIFNRAAITLGIGPHSS